MKKGKRRKSRGLRPERRSRIFLRLTDSELAELERAALESGALSRNLVVTEAVKLGLVNPALSLCQLRRSKRIHVWIPRRTAAELKQLATKHSLKQSQLLRLFLFQYLATAPWNEAGPSVVPNEGRGREVAVL